MWLISFKKYQTNNNNQIKTYSKNLFIIIISTKNYNHKDNTILLFLLKTNIKLTITTINTTPIPTISNLPPFS